MWGGAWSALTKSAGDLLGSDLVEKARVAARDVADAASKVSDTVQAEYRRTFVELDCQIFEIRPDIIVMEYPAEDKIDRLATRLNADYAQRMLIYNMSEKKYDTTKFAGEIVDVAFRGLPAPPVELLMELCLSAHRWLSSDPSHVLLVHCFQGYSRSAVFLSCLLAFRGLCAHPVDGLHEVCAQLGIDDATAIVPSQRRYLTYFQQCQQGLSPSNARVRLLRVQLNGVPRFESEDNVALRPYVEVWNRGEMIYTSFSRPPPQARPGADAQASSSSSAPDAAPELPKGVAPTEPCACFQFPEDTYIAGDVLIRVRHVYLDGSRDTALRLAFHTGLVSSEGLQLARRELDTACSDPRFPEDAFLDVSFELAPTSDDAAAEAEAQPIFDKARGVAQKLREEALAAEAKANAEAQKAAAAAAAAKTAAAAGATEAAPKGEKPKGAEAEKVAAVGEDEIDQLFCEFDDVLDSVVLGKPGEASAAPAVSAEAKKEEASAPSQSSSTSAAAPAKAAAPPASTDDVFAEVDDFLKDPLAALEAETAQEKKEDPLAALEAETAQEKKEDVFS